MNLMENYVVGTFCQPETEVRQNNLNYYHVCLMMLDIERNLGYLLGLHAFNLRQSLPLAAEEVSSSQWLKSAFLSGGLEVRIL